MAKKGSLPEHPTRDAGFILRLGEIAGGSGNISAFARAAGVPTASLHSYLSGSEPTRPVLAALARAGKVSIDWLATGEASKQRLPEDYDDYISIPFFDLSLTGNHIRAVLGQFDHPPIRRLFPRSYLDEAADLAGAVFGIEGCAEGLSFDPQVCERDILIVDREPEHAIAKPTAVEAWPVIEDTIYLVSIGVDLRLRKLRRLKKGDSVELVTAQGNAERLTGVPRDVILFGRVVWRGGALPPLKPPLYQPS